MQHSRWVGVAAAGLMAVASAPLVSAAPALTSGGPARHVTASTSHNWSGYVNTDSKKFTLVQANWTEPSYKCNGSTPESSVIWVGLDGWTSTTVEQGGTIAICNGTKQGTHFAWWEMFPHNAIQEVFPVNIGDRMFASVTYTAGNAKPFNIFVWDETTDVSLSMNEACSSTCTRNSAEWIVETPSFGSQLAFLPKFKPITLTEGFSSVGAAQTPVVDIAGFPHQAITMTGASGNRAVPYALASNGQGFTDKWISSAP
jgi:hypothetical protein